MKAPQTPRDRANALLRAAYKCGSVSFEDEGAGLVLRRISRRSDTNIQYGLYAKNGEDLTSLTPCMGKTTMRNHLTSLLTPDSVPVER